MTETPPESNVPCTVSIIAAIGGEKRVIGNNGKLPWDIKEDLEHFRQITTGHVIVMGRKTFESIGRPLPKRTNIVITRDISFSSQGIITAYSLEDALQKACSRTGSKKEIFVIGGGEIYKEALPFASKLYLTVIEGDYEGDAFFPDMHGFGDIVSEEASSSGKYSFSFVEIERSHNPTGKLF